MKTLTLYRPSFLENFENVFHDFDKSMESLMGHSKMFGYLPAVDIGENENGYILSADLPGYDEKNIQVHIFGGDLTIEAKSEEAEKKDGNYIIQERRKTSIKRSFKLPENADPESIKAVFKNGVLTLEIKKRTESQSRSIPVEAG